MKCEIEANIGCCDSCLQKVRRNLERIRGVESVEMYPEIKRVVVWGKVEHRTLLCAVQEVKPTARIMTVEASRPANNSGVVNDEDGGELYQSTKKTKKKKKKNVASIVAPVNEEPTLQNDTVDSYPESPLTTRDRIASEATTYALNLTAYGFGGEISYRKDVTYK